MYLYIGCLYEYSCPCCACVLNSNDWDTSWSFKVPQLRLRFLQQHRRYGVRQIQSSPTTFCNCSCKMTYCVKFYTCEMLTTYRVGGCLITYLLLHFHACVPCILCISAKTNWDLTDWCTGLFVARNTSN